MLITVLTALALISIPESTHAEVKATDYGVVCDGVTDDRANLQSALNSANRVVLPTGTCLVTNAGGGAALIINDNQELVGEGNGTIIKLADNQNATILAITNHSNIGIYNLVLDGNRANQTAAAHGIRGVGNTNIRVENVNIVETSGYGIGFQAGTAKDIRIDNVIIKNTGSDGIDFKNLNSDNSGIFISNVTVENPGRSIETETQAGIDIRGIAHLSNINVTGLDTDQHGIRFRESSVETGQGGHYSSLTNFYVQGTGTSSYGVYVPADRVTVSNGTVNGTFIGIYVYGAHNSVDNVKTHGSGTGFLLETNANYVTLSACEAKAGLGKGFVIKSDYSIMNGIIAQGNSNAGIEITSTSDGAVVSGSVFRSNGAANIKSGTNTVSGANYSF